MSLFLDNCRGRSTTLFLFWSISRIQPLSPTLQREVHLMNHSYQCTHSCWLQLLAIGHQTLSAISEQPSMFPNHKKLQFYVHSNVTEPLANWQQKKKLVHLFAFRLLDKNAQTCFILNSMYSCQLREQCFVCFCVEMIIICSITI